MCNNGLSSLDIAGTNVAIYMNFFFHGWITIFFAILAEMIIYASKIVMSV